MSHARWSLLLVALVIGCSDPDPSGNDAGIPNDGQAHPDAQVLPDAVPDPELLGIEDVTYVGAFRVSSDDFGASNANYTVGTLAYNPVSHSLFIAGHAQHNCLAEFPIPTPGQAADVASLPLVEAPLQPFTAVLDAAPGGNPEELDRITGMLCEGGQLILNAERWYDAGGTVVDTTLVIRDASDLGGAVDGYFELGGAAHAGGYLGPVPAEWQAALGGTHLTGWASNYSIISRYSVGPSLFVFDPQDLLATGPGAQGPVATSVLMDFPHGDAHYLGADALTTEEGSAPALWNFLSRAMYAFIVPGTRTFAAFGSSGGVDSGIGYKITQDDGNLCGGYCAYAADDYYNHYWFFDLDEILAATDPWDPRPYAFGRWSVPFDDGGRHAISGGAFDPASRTLYLALDGAGQVGEYDRPPLIVVFEVGP